MRPEAIRSLVVAENLPYPTFKGGDLRNWQNVNALLGLGEVGVFGLCSTDRRIAPPSRDIRVWRASSDPLLAIPPPPERLAAARAWLLDPSAHPAEHCCPPAAVAELRHLMREFQPHIVIIERLWLHRYIDVVRPFGPRVVLDDHNVEAVLSRQMADASADGAAHPLVWKALPTRAEAIERRAVRSVDQVWACSEGDARHIDDLYQRHAPLYVVPNGVDVSTYAHLRSPARSACALARRTVLFPGTFDYGPNAAAARFLIEQLHPNLRAKHPDYRLVLAGSRPTPQMVDSALRDERIIVTGTVPDMRTVFGEASAVAVPLFEGSGTRFKILEAFAAGVPVVSTRRGAEGLAVEHGRELLMAETPEAFAAAIEGLWAQPALRERLTRHAFELVRQQYSWSVAARRIAEALADLVGADTLHPAGGV